MKKFSEFTQDDLDRIDDAKSKRSFKAAETRKREAERAKDAARKDLARALILGDRSNRDLWEPGITVTYRKAYLLELIKRTRPTL